jgi:hypothetical protein
MIRLIFAAVLTVAATTAQAQTPNPQKLQKCRDLARERGFLGGGYSKGAIKPRDFIIACMQGKQS